MDHSQSVGDCGWQEFHSFLEPLRLPLIWSDEVSMTVNVSWSGIQVHEQSWWWEPGSLASPPSQRAGLDWRLYVPHKSTKFKASELAYLCNPTRPLPSMPVEYYGSSITTAAQTFIVHMIKSFLNDVSYTPPISDSLRRQALIAALSEALQSWNIAKTVSHMMPTQTRIVNHSAAMAEVRGMHLILFATKYVI